jgi:hypothetical protein
MAVFIEKSPVTSSNCYNTIKTASTLIKLGTNVDWTLKGVKRRYMTSWVKIVSNFKSQLPNTNPNMQQTASNCIILENNIVIKTINMQL